MENKESILLEVVPKIKSYIKDDTIKEKSYQDFISKNKDLFICNLYNINMITDEDIKLLYITIEQNMDIDDKSLVAIFSYIGYNFEKNIHEEQSSLDTGDRITGDMNYNMYDMFYSTLDFIIRQKHVNILVNDEGNNDVNINYRTITSSLSYKEEDNYEQVVNEIPFNMKELLSYVSKNLEQLRFSKKYLDFAYLCRNIGIKISKRKFNVRYVFNYVIDELTIPIVIRDYLDVKYVYLAETNKTYRNNFDSNNKNFLDWGKVIIPLLKNPRLYSYFFLSNYGLCDLFLDLINIKSVTFKTREIPLDYIYVDDLQYWKEEDSIEFVPCEHEIAMIEAKKISLDYYDKINNFVAKYIIYEDGLAYCNICGINIQELNIDATDVMKISQINVTYNKSIFMSEPYNYFSHSQRFIFNTIMSFDTIMKSQMWSMKYNINRLILNFLIDINGKRHEYEKKFAQEIKKGIFFLRLSANLFDIQMSSMELFYSAKILNIHYIVAFVIVLNSGADFIMSYMSNKKKDVDYSDMKYNISVIIFDFLRKTRIADQGQFNTISLFTETYLSIATEELLVHYNRIILEMNRLIQIRKDRTTPDYDISVYKEIIRDDKLRFFPSSIVSTNLFITYKKKDLSYIQSIIIKHPVKIKKDTAEERERFNDIIKKATKVLIRVNDTNASNTAFFTTHVKLEVEKKKIIIPLNSLFVYNVLKYYSSNVDFYVFKFGDPFPFHYELISIEHVNYKIRGYNMLRQNLLPNSNVFTYYSNNLNRHELEFNFYIFLSSYVNVTEWIEENSKRIKDLYITNFNN
ncbi:RNA polymerase-associated transcription specificity factor [Finch poxvirus]|uniref:RNA polymerase-associated transcription-specificity factor RAP94 n=2 Tax=unclassified Avipoxvirus TaxID=336487 RepID=A0AAT9UPU2_9POXV|nr:RNA polymerase-associated transcription specificity factor [Finch poxvirus]UOX39183.1 RNA polymerase-associated transcription specificity factor [Finch poxvirus]